MKKRNDNQHVDHNFELQQATCVMPNFDIKAKQVRELRNVMNHSVNLRPLNPRANRQKAIDVRRALHYGHCDTEAQRRSLQKTLNTSKQLLAEAKKMNVSKETQDVLKSAIGNTRRCMKKKTK